MIRGGQSVNSIAADARIDLDLRSADAALLADLRARAVRAAGERFPAAGALRAEVSSLGSRPAGLIDAAHALVGHARAARAHLGLDPAREVAASTDANLPLSRGIPATCLGIGTGVDAHKPTERLRIEGLDRGFLALLETVRRAAGDPGLRRG
jgi:di/tripeptidase